MARYIDITLDKPRRLRYDVNALDTLERMMDGAPLGQIIVLIGQKSIRAAKLALLAGLRHEDRKLTADHVGDLLQTYFDDGGDYDQLSDLLAEALFASGVMKKPDEEAAPPDPPATRVTTETSTPTASLTG